MLNIARVTGSFLFLFYSLIVFAQAGYNEAYDENGKLRPLYKEIAPIVQNMSPAELERFRINSRRAFLNDNALDPMPRLISTTEFNTLKKGVDQRAKALVSFLKDYFSGERRFEKAGIIPKGVVDKIAARNGDILYQGLVNPREINFFYGPDIIRDQGGTWRVIEDNPGFIGGIGDLKIAQEFMLRSFPEFQQKLKIKNADDFYETISEAFKQKAAANGGRAVIYMQPPYADNEDYRIQEIFAPYGIEVMTPRTAHKKLVINDDGVFLDYFFKGKRIIEKVGFLFLNGEHAWIDNDHPASRVRNILEAANEMMASPKTKPKHRLMVQQALESVDPKTHLPDVDYLESLINQYSPYAWKSKAKLPGLLNAVLSGKVSINYTPGIDFIGDKQFYMYVEDLIRFYLKQEPIVQNIPTRSFANKDGSLNVKVFNDYAKNYKTQVAKKVDGRGGDGVLVGPKAQHSEVEQLKQRIKPNPTQYITQEFLNLSELNGLIVDIRVITMVLDWKSYIASTPWGRGLPKDGNGKVNLSDKGREVAVFVVEKGKPSPYEPSHYSSVSCLQILNAPTK